MLLGSPIDWTQVLIALIAGLPSTIAAIGAIYLAKQLRTPSGDTPGALIERTHELAIVNTEMTMDVHKQVGHPPEQTTKEE